MFIVRRALLGISVLLAAGCGPDKNLEAASQELDAAYARAVEIGLSLTLEEANGPLVPDEDNVVSGLRPLMDEWTRNRKSADKYEPSEPRPADMAAIDDAFLAKADEVLWRPQAQFVHPSTIQNIEDPDFENMPFRIFPKFKQSAKALAWRASERARAGDIEGAVQDVNRVRRLAWALGQDSTLIGALVGVASDAIVLQEIPGMTESMRIDRTSLARLREAIQSSWPQFSLRRSTRFEVFSNVDLARNVAASGGLTRIAAQFSEGDEESDVPPLPPGKLPEWSPDGKPNDLEGRASLARVLQLWGHAQTAPGMSNAEFGDALADAGAKVRTNVDSDRSYLLASLVFLFFEGAGQAFFKAEVRHELAIAGLRVMEHRALTGQLPQSLRDAGAVDKVQGREIHYAVKDGAFCVWTNGPDGVNQGPHFAIPDDRRPDDISMTFPPIKKAEAAL
jgi:hypothetical protein